MTVQLGALPSLLVAHSASGEVVSAFAIYELMTDKFLGYRGFVICKRDALELVFHAGSHVYPKPVKASKVKEQNKASPQPAYA